jgi:hypothetical protein
MEIFVSRDKVGLVGRAKSFVFSNQECVFFVSGEIYLDRDLADRTSVN